MWSNYPKLAVAATAAFACAAAQAQEDPAPPPDIEAAAPQADALTRPPEIEARVRSPERPGAARLADAPARSAAPRDEVVVVGEQRWQLPDLGSELRDARSRDADARIRAEFLTPHDPADPTNRFEPYPLDGDLTRVGFIELFRIGFGGP